MEWYVHMFLERIQKKEEGAEGKRESKKEKISCSFILSVNDSLKTSTNVRVVAL